MWILASPLHLAPFPDQFQASADSTANSVPAHPSSSQQRPAQHLEDSVLQNSPPTYLAPPSPLQHPQDQASTFQGPNRPQGALNGAHDFVMINTVLNDYSTTTVTGSFMEKLLQETIIGAEFDSSARYPPPRCHPGTRLAIIQRCLDFVTQCQDGGKLRWVVGPAGVGKSAVMQMVTEKACNSVIFASVFLSVSGRRDGTKTILTIAYQLAVKWGPYRQFIQGQIGLDPSLFHKPLPVHFTKFIVEPFMLDRLFEPSFRFLVVIDGLDECDSPSTQEELLKLITDFCITYPTSPISWIVANRPEPHITSFFDQAEVKQAYTKEEIEVDSDEAREEVEKYLRDELKKIQSKHLTLRRKRDWPLEHEFTKIASSAGGLFAYAATVIRYIRDTPYGDPALQLRHVLETIDARLNHQSGREHPMARLDALYKRILSSIPDDVMTNTRKLLLMPSADDGAPIKFRQLSNMLGLTEDGAYGAVRYLYAVMKIPEPVEADNEVLSHYHKSFADFLLDSTRSGFSDDFKNEAIQLSVQASLRIIRDVSVDSYEMAGDEVVSIENVGYLRGCPGVCDQVSLSWPGDVQTIDNELRLLLYSYAVANISCGFKAGMKPFVNVACFGALTTCFTVLGVDFPFFQIRDFVFDKHRHELEECGILKQVPLRGLNFTAICGPIDLQYDRSPDNESSGSWNTSCEHEKEERLMGWSTSFGRYEEDDWSEDDDAPSINGYEVGDELDATELPGFNLHAASGNKFHWSFLGEECLWAEKQCNHCLQRLASHFMDNSDQLATIFVDSTELCYGELSLVDPEDKGSLWTYRFFHSGSPQT